MGFPFYLQSRDMHVENIDNYLSIRQFNRDNPIFKALRIENSFHFMQSVANVKNSNLGKAIPIQEKKEI